VQIEDYALIGDTQTAALVGRDTSIDWCCFPRFDSGACFAALLGAAGQGRWRFRPAGSVRSTRRRYRDDTLVLETELTTDEGVVRVVDCMPIRGAHPDIVRVVEGVSGDVRMEMELVVRFDYGVVIPWVRSGDGWLSAVAGPDAVLLRTPVRTHGRDLTTIAEFTVGPGDAVPFVLTWHSSIEDPPPPVDALAAVADTAAWWREWMRSCQYDGPWADAVRRSVLTLKALTYEPTGGIVAAPTTSLPERIGGVRNWDYRYCWLRDATFTLDALMQTGFESEAKAWRDWLLRAVAGAPSQLQILYGVAGERRIVEQELPWLPGYEDSAPVRVGNAAAAQFQLDVFGELMDSMHQARMVGIEPDENSWELQLAVIDFVADHWREPDEGIWEVRGPRRHFTHSKVMAWVAVDRAVRAVERFGLPGDIDRWRMLRREIHHDVCTHGVDAKRKVFTQSYGAPALDASVLLIPLVGFLPPRDERVVATVEAVRDELGRDGLVRRYLSQEEGTHEVDGLPGGEGTFLPCSFWLCDALALMGRVDEARKRFEKLLALSNDLGLLAEEYDPGTGRQVGNFPQAFSHVALVNTAHNLADGVRPRHHRRHE
jgi:GH15 family glucan-1,4-alpha-glucosidase